MSGPGRGECQEEGAANGVGCGMWAGNGSTRSQVQWRVWEDSREAEAELTLWPKMLRFPVQRFGKPPQG